MRMHRMQGWGMTTKEKLEKRRDELAEKYDDEFEFVGSYSSIDMYNTYKAGFNALLPATLKLVEALEETCCREPDKESKTPCCISGLAIEEFKKDMRI